MTSHISVSITSGQSGASTTGFSALGGAGKASGGGFAALLDALRGGSADHSVADVVKKLIHPGTADTDATLAVPLEATAGSDTTDPTTTPATGKTAVLAQLVSALSDLDKSLQSGQPVEEDLLKRVKQAVDAVNNFLAAQQPAAIAASAPAADGVGGAAAAPVGAAGSTPSPADATPASDSTTADAGKAQLAALDAKLVDLGSSLAKTHPDVAQKLDQLAKSLDPKAVTADAMAQLGLGSTDDAPDPDLQSAINALAVGKVATPAAQPVLATPALKLPTDSSIAHGGKDEPASPAATQLSAAPVASGSKPPPTPVGNAGDNGADSHGKDDSKAAATAAAAVAATDAAPDKAAPATSPTTATTPAPNAVTPPVAADATRLGAAAYQSAAAAQINLPALAVDIVRHVQQGSSHFQIRLDPADMGRVDVRLAIDATGAVSARLSAERPETLDLLRRDAGQLGAALSQAGLDAGKTNLQFSLSQNPFARQDGSAGNGNPAYAAPASTDDVSDTAAPATTTLYRGVVSSRSLNIFV